MLRRLVASAFLALLFVLAFAFSVSAQGTDPEDAPLMLEPITATISQAVPLSLTLTVPGPNGLQVIVLPVTVTLDIRLEISSDITATVLASAEPVTASVPTTIVVDLPATPEPEATPEEPDTEPTAEPPSILPTATPTAGTAEPTAAPDDPATPQPTSTPTPVNAQVVTAPVCPDPRSVISLPGVNQVVSGLVEVWGTATHPEFQYYKVEYAVGGADGAEYVFLDSSGAEVQDGLLTVLNTAEFVNGVYSLRLIVVDRSGNYPPPCEVTIVIQN